MGKVAIEHYIGFWTDKLEDYPGQLAIADEQIRTAAEELVLNVICVEQIQEVGEALVLADAHQIRRSANAQ